MHMQAQISEILESDAELKKHVLTWIDDILIFSPECEPPSKATSQVLCLVFEIPSPIASGKVHLIRHKRPLVREIH